MCQASSQPLPLAVFSCSVQQPPPMARGAPTAVALNFFFLELSTAADTYSIAAIYTRHWQDH